MLFRSRVRTTIPEHKWYNLEPGRMKMDGKLALAYLRFRSDKDVDFGRTNRQRNFLVELLKQSMSMGKIFRAPFMVAAASEAIRTDLSIGEGIHLLRTLRGKNLQELPMAGLKATPRAVDGKAVVHLDMEYMQSVVAQYILRTEAQQQP